MAPMREPGRPAHVYWDQSRRSQALGIGSSTDIRGRGAVRTTRPPREKAIPATRAGSSPASRQARSSGSVSSPSPTTAKSTEPVGRNSEYMNEA